MTAFDIAVGAMFRDPNVARAATWRVAGTGAPQPIRVISIDPDPVFQLSGARVANDGVVLEVVAADVVGIAEGDTIAVGATTYRVQAQPLRQADGLIWRLDVSEL